MAVFSAYVVSKLIQRLAAVVRDLLYADDCALMAHLQTDVQHLFNHLLNAITRFGLTVSLKKTQVMLQPFDLLDSTPPVILAGQTPLPVIEKFCYLGNVLS